MSRPSNVTDEHIAAAQLRMVLDQKLGRVTPDVVRRIAAMESPQHSGLANVPSVPDPTPVEPNPMAPPDSGYTVTPSQSRTRPLRVLVADDHQLFRYGVVSVLETAPDIQVVGDSTTSEVVSAAARLVPDVIMLDSRLQGDSGPELMRTILEAQPDVRILILSMFEDDDEVLAALRAGAAGFLRKSSDSNEIIRAVRAIGAGEAIFSAAIATRITDLFTTPGEQPAAAPLTKREREVLNLVASGRSSSRIAHDLSLSPQTVRNHISSIFAKLQVVDPTRATQESQRGDS